MANGDGNGMSYKDAVIEFQKTQAEMRKELSTQLDALLENQSFMMARSETHGKAIEKNENKIHDLEKADRRWAGVVTFLAALEALIIGLWRGSN